MTNSIERSDAIKHDNEKEEATTKTRAELSQEAIEDAIKQIEAMRTPSGALLGCEPTVAPGLIVSRSIKIIDGESNED
jgi:hypothetical protein